MRIKDCSVGDPMGFKVNDSPNLVLSDIIKSLEIYHGNRYIVGYDKSFIEKPHYHINFFCVRSVSENARKVFRNSMSKKFPYLDRADKLYTGEVLPSADNDRWIAYAMKETLIEVSGIEITENIKVLAKSCFETKRQNKVYSEKKENLEKEKKQFRDKLLEYVKLSYDSYKIPDIYLQDGFYDAHKVRLLVIKFLKENQREGSLTKSHIERYTMYCNIHLFEWDEYKIMKSLYIL
jgi:hypothetical protein